MSYTEMSEYNGWTNKPTWMLNLYFEPSQDEYWIEQATDIIEHYVYETGSIQPNCRFELADLMKDYYEDYLYQEHIGNSPFDDFTTFAFAFINWDEIAEHVIEQAEYQLENEV